MPFRRPITRTLDIALRTIVKKSDAQHKENSDRLISIAEQMASIATAMTAHIQADAASFHLLGDQLIALNNDVKSLLASRSFLRGTWFAVTIAATLLATLAGIAITLYKLR